MGSGRLLRGPVRIVATAIGIAAFVGGFAFALVLLDLDRTVRARFEGVQFRVPSRVFSAPTILYPGLDWKRAELRLDDTGSRDDDGPRPGYRLRCGR